MPIADGQRRARRAVTSALLLVAGLTTIAVAERPGTPAGPDVADVPLAARLTGPHLLCVIPHDAPPNSDARWRPLLP